MKLPYLVSESTTLETARDAIQNSAGILVVVDQSRKLLGIVTPGDIARARKDGLSKLSTVRTFMNPNPRTAAAGKPRGAYLDLLKKWHVRQIPIVDRRRRVKDLVHIYEKMNLSEMPLANFWERYAINWNFGRKFHEKTQLGYEWFSEDVPKDVIQKRLNDMVRTRLRPAITQKMKILEIGCGGARIGARVAPLCSSYIGLDASREMLKIAAREFQNRRISNFKLVLGNGRAVPLPDGSVDLVFSYDVFVHFPVHLAVRYLQESFRVLDSGGRLIVHFAKVTDDRIADHLISETDQRMDLPPGTPGHWIEYTDPETIGRVAGQIGFKVEAVKMEEARFWVFARKH